MLVKLRAVRPCLNGSSSDDDRKLSYSKTNQSISGRLFLDNKLSLSQSGKRQPSRDQVAEKLISVMRDATYSGKASQSDLDAIVHEAGWWDGSIAERMLAMLEKILEAGTVVGSAMRSAFEKVYQEARKIVEIAEVLAREHPILTGVVCTVIALGILYLMWPWMLQALGFTRLGPLANSFAARWQSLYGARVPVGSLFAYLQRLGMTWNGNIIVVSAAAATKL